MSKKKILLIDDEEDFSTLLKLNIDKATEYEVLVANRGEAGLELVNYSERLYFCYASPLTLPSPPLGERMKVRGSCIGCNESYFVCIT